MLSERHERAASAVAPASAVGSARRHPKVEVHQEPQPACFINPAAAVARPDHGSLQALVFGKGVREILRKAADVLQNKLTRAQYLDEVTWTTKSWGWGCRSSASQSFFTRPSPEQIVNELACGEGGRVHGAKCLAVLVSGYATVA